MADSAYKAPANATDTTALVVVPLRHPFRIAAITMVVISVAAILYSVFTNKEFQWPIVGHYMLNPIILRGLATTITLTVAVMIIAVIIGTIAALMMLSPSRLLSVPARVFVWLFRGAPALVQLILWYNLSIVFKTITLWLPGVGTIFSVQTNDVMTPMTAAIVALSLHEAGYMAEIVRSGLNSVVRGQTEAALSLGMRPALSIRRIVLPQAMRLIIPPTGNEAINLLKTTSLVSIIAVGDLLYSAQAIYARTFETLPLLIVVTIWYLITVSVMSFGQYHLERYFSKDDRKTGRGRSRGILRRIFSFRQRAAVA
ncbi:amino acid ABC transporter permease [Neoaquamicrobium sediminum]|uniref:amino acid ABC transporter permease n=1 Tax=Neoaquamicrobium sediminum TaxID=1849104 RepID=UPI0015630374|nr:amino acid ABC transporter permease [Mesorhizobium sediminum]NRC57328.1 amino acid ABC transporter permease [Mesorhizobium sediminum]